MVNFNSQNSRASVLEPTQKYSPMWILLPFFSFPLATGININAVKGKEQIIALFT